jgi:hypothetical protein
VQGYVVRSGGVQGHIVRTGCVQDHVVRNGCLQYMILGMVVCKPFIRGVGVSWHVGSRKRVNRSF